MSGPGLWHGVFHQANLLVDVGILVVLGGIHIWTWTHETLTDVDPNNKAGDGLRTAAMGGLTAVSILLPVNLLAVQLTGTHPLPRPTVIGLFVSSTWLLLSLVFGLYVLFVAVTQAYSSSPLKRRDIGIAFGLQLILLIVGVERLIWGFSALAGSLV